MRNAARATHVVGEVLQSSGDGTLRRPGAWVALLGRRLGALVEAAIPKTISHMLFRHVTTLLYGFGLVALLLGLFIDFARPLRTPALVLLAGVGAIDLVVFLLGAVMRSWNTPARVVGITAVSAVILALVASVILGAPRLGPWLLDSVRTQNDEQVVVVTRDGQRLQGVLVSSDREGFLVLCRPGRGRGETTTVSVPRENVSFVEAARGRDVPEAQHGTRKAGRSETNAADSSASRIPGLTRSCADDQS